MNYFELFGLPVSLLIDEVYLLQRYLSMPGSELHSTAYETLTDRNRRVQYILELHDLLQPGEKMQLPHMFMMEMMALNEQLFALEVAPAADILKFRRQMEKMEARMWKELRPEEPLNPGRLDELKTFYFQQKYLFGIQQRFSTFASRDQVL